MKKIVLILSIVIIVMSSIVITNNKEKPKPKSKPITKLDTKALHQFRADHIASIVNRNEEVKSNIVVLDDDFVIVGVTLKKDITPEKENILLGRIKKNIYFTDGQVNKVYITTNVGEVDKIRNLLKTSDSKTDLNNLKEELNLLIKELTPIY